MSLRAARKSIVFPIMYGSYPYAHADELVEWRLMAADYINGHRDDVPLTLEGFRSLASRHLRCPQTDREETS